MITENYAIFTIDRKLAVVVTHRPGVSLRDRFPAASRAALRVGGNMRRGTCDGRA